MSVGLDSATLDRLFRTARSTHAFTAEPVTDATLHALYDLLKWGPTAFNTQPGRYLFARSAEAKARLGPLMSEGNRAKTLAAPVTVIVASDLAFYDELPTQFPSFNAKPLFLGNAALAEATAQRNGTLQGAYLLIAARALGLDVGPMSGFDVEGVNREFFAGTSWHANFLVNLGYSDGTHAFPRGPRLGFDQVARIL
jgi:nitroreductase